MRALKIAASAIAAIVVIAALLLIVGIPSGFLTSTIHDRVERETGYHLMVAGSTKLGMWPSLNVTMSDVKLERPNDRDAGSRLAAGSIQADLTLASLWSGHPDITELVINHPEISVPLHRERRPAVKTTSSPPNASPDNASNTPAIERVTVNDGVVRFFNTHDGVERRIEGISARATIGADRGLSLKGNARAGGHPLTFDVKASMPNPPMARQNIPVELSLDAPGLLRTPLSSKAEVRINGTVVMINGISGSSGDGAFDGWASVDFASKPLVKLDLDFRRLDLAATPAQAAPQDATARAWSNTSIDLVGLNYVDAQLRLSAAELNIGAAHFAPAAIEASLASGQLKGSFSKLGAYGGQANGSIDIDVSRDTPVYALRCDLTSVRALPLLSSAASFDKLDGKLDAKIDVRSSGQSQQVIMSNLAGSVTANFQDGAIRGLNVAQMIRSLASSTLSGWQESQEQTTDLSQLSASFRIDKGQATSTDLDLVGPLVKMTGGGTIDLGAQTLALRVEPKLVMTTEGQGRSSDPVAFGIPVKIDGPWASPRIYPDVTGGDSGNATGGNSLGETLGNLIQQGLNAARSRGNQPNASPDEPSPDNPSAPGPNDPSRQQGTRQLNNLLKQFLGR